MTATVYLSLGSNLGDRVANLRNAIAAVPAAGLRILKVSSFYETQPVDYLEQAWFGNCAVQAETELAPLDLLHRLRGIETKMGSKKLVPKGPRLIDLDILLYGDQFVDTPELQLPHPRMHLRRFVLVPLNEIAPDVHHPRLHRPISELLRECPDTSEVRLLELSSG